MARTKQCSRQRSPRAMVNCVALGSGGKELTLQPVPPRAAKAAQPGGAGARGRGVGVHVSSSKGSLVMSSQGDAALSPTMAVVAAVRAWQASPPTGGTLIHPLEGSPRSDRRKSNEDPLLAAEHPCTVCGEVMPRHALQRHPTLPVASCERCVRYFLSDGRPDYWGRDSNGKERYCSWCAHNSQCHDEGGGVVVQCSREDCPKVFCAACITRNFGGKHYLETTKTVAWQCYVCAPDILQTLASHEVVAADKSEPAGSTSAVGDRNKTRSALSQLLEKWLSEHPECLVGGKVQAPDRAVKEQLAAKYNVSVARVSDWFWDQNRRRKKSNNRSRDFNPQTEPGAETMALGRCSACGTGTTLVAHDLLNVKVCRSCFSALHGLASCAAKDRPKGAAPACRWCGRSDTPTVTCADASCPSGGHGYCENCVTRNFSYAAWKDAARSYTLGQWSCYACQPERLRAIPELGCRISVAFEGEGPSIGLVVGIDGPGVAPGQLRVQFDPPGSDPWLIDPAAGHLFEVLTDSAALPRPSPKVAAGRPTGNGDTADAVLSAVSPTSNWTPEMRQRLVALVQRDGTGDWQRKAELLGYGHTAKQVNNKWRSIVQTTAAFQTAANAQPGHATGPSVAAIPKARKLTKKSAAPPSVTVIHKGEPYDVPLAETGSADARAARLEAKIRAELQMLPGQRFVLMGTKGKVSLATVATQPGGTFAAQIVDKRRRGTVQAATVLREEAVGTTPQRTSAKRQGPSPEGQPAPKKAAHKPPQKPVSAAPTPTSKAQLASESATAWVRALGVGDCVNACDYRGDWHEGRVVELQRFQVRAALFRPCPPPPTPSRAPHHLRGLTRSSSRVGRRPRCTSSDGTRGTTSGSSAPASDSAAHNKAGSGPDGANSALGRTAWIPGCAEQAVRPQRPASTANSVGVGGVECTLDGACIH